MFIINWLRKIGKTFTGDQRRPASQARRFTRLAVEGLEERALPAALSPVNPGAAYPFSSIVKVQATFPDGQTYVGSGTMVDSFQVLTAGHVIYRTADGGWASSVKVIPGEYVGANDLLKEPVGYALAQKGGLQTFSTFINSDHAHPGQFAYGDEDVGMISLDRNIGDRTGWMNFGYYNNGLYAPGTILKTAGYPAAGPGYDGYHMESGSGPIAGMSPDGSDIDYFQASIPTYKGQSGSPLWTNSANGSPVVLGVVTAGNGTATSLNAATDITPGIYKGLVQMMAAGHKPVGDPIQYDPSSYVGGQNPVSGGGTVYTFMSQAISTNLAESRPSVGADLHIKPTGPETTLTPVKHAPITHKMVLANRLAKDAFDPSRDLGVASSQS